MSKFTIGLFLVILSFLLTLPWISRPFTGHHDFTGAFYSQMARNYLRYGLITTKLGQVTNLGETTPAQFTYHTHHPPGIPLVIAGFYAIFGEHEWAARLVPMLFALGATWFLFALIAKKTSPAIAAIATLFTITTPLFVYTAILPEYEAAALFFVLLQCYSFDRWKHDNDQRFKIIFLIAAILGYITAWVTYFAIPILLLNELLAKRITHLKSLLLFAGLAVGFFGLHLIHTKILTGTVFGGGIQHIFLKRIGVSPETDPRYVFSTQKYLATEAKRLKNFYGFPMIALASIGVIVTIVQKRKDGARVTFLLLLCVALVLPVFFRNYAFVHDYMLFYFAPLLGFLATLGLIYIAHLSSSHPRVSHFVLNEAGKCALRACCRRKAIPDPKRSKGEWVTASKHISPASEEVRNSSHREILACAIPAFLIVNTLAVRIVWKDLWESRTWYEASPIIGERLRRTTAPGQSILVVNQLLRDQETQLSYYADRAISFPSGHGVIDDPDVIVNVSSDFQFPEKQREQIGAVYRLEIEQGVEYYYRK